VEEICLANIKVEVPDEIKMAAEEIVLSAETLGKNTALRSVGVVQRILYARWCGHSKIGSIARFAGISRSMLNRYLENGESATHPCYDHFRAACDQFFQGTVTNGLHNLRKSATAPGNWKAADAFSRYRIRNHLAGNHWRGSRPSRERRSTSALANQCA
jgi:hypothetical protein